MSVGEARSPARSRIRVRVTGTVQGVGFRPFVYRLAAELDLAGHVLNDERGVLLEVEGRPAALAQFAERLRSEAPPLAVVDAIARTAVSVRGEAGFRILDSERHDPGTAPPIAPDCATCEDCLAECSDPSDRRHRYPFINCTNCGPRFTIVTGVPYDRPLTTMAPFAMCPECAREYGDPDDRRFHAQPNACPRCGPALRLADGHGRPLTDLGGCGDAIAFTAARLAAGAIVAVKSIGGFHLVCDGGHEAAVSALRARKHREDKPFALLVGSVQAAGALVSLTDADIALLTGPARPIVLAPRRVDGDRRSIAAAVAPGLTELGVMLPYAPLHHLLIADFAAACGDPGRPLVCTSGNVSDEPIAYSDEDALVRLGAIADLFVLHDRAIETRTDDSVVRTVTLPRASATPGRETGVPCRSLSDAESDRHGTTVAGDGVSQALSERVPLMIRRSRGCVPAPLALPVPAPRPLLACGAEQKSTFCLAAGDRAWVGHHIGDLEHHATLEAFRQGIDHFSRLFAIVPEVIAHDLHPDYLSTSDALAREAAAHVAVQHHHAHLAACLAEHGRTAPAVGAIYDGTGLGADGTVWGGELLCGDLTGFTRAGRLWPVRMPGGAAAVRQPWRMAAAWLREAFGEPRPLPRRLGGILGAARWRAIDTVAASPEVSPVTSSIGRLLDAIGALCGLPCEVTYEGQAAIALEAAAWEARSARRYELELRPAEDGTLVLDPRGLLRALADDLERGADVSEVAAGVHDALSAATTDALVRVAGEARLGTAVLSGGVFQNRRLLEATAAGLHAAGLRVLVPRALPPNDGQIAFGQAAVAAARDGGR